MRKKLIEMLERMIIELMQGAKIPGMSIGIIIDGEITYKRGFGSRNLETNNSMTPNTLFGIGSISKMFTALAINQLADQGKLNLHDPINKFFNFKLGKRKNPITIHHFLTHSSGINALEGGFIAAERLLGVSDSFVPMSSAEDLLDFINGATIEIFDEPGGTFIYNNDMFDVLGLIIEEVSGVKFIEFVKNNIFKPLEMTRSTYLKEDYEKDSDVAMGYVIGDNGKILSKDVPLSELQAPCGGMLSSVNELLNYINAILNDGSFKGNQIIKKSSLETILTPYIETDELEKEYGYGWRIERNFFGYKLVCHSGNIFVSSAFLGVIPELKMGIIIGQNCGHFDPDIIGKAILAILLGVDIKEAIPLLEIQKKLNFLIGHYETYKGVMKLDVTLENGILIGKVRYPGTSNIISFPVVIDNMEEMKFDIPFAIPVLEMKGQFFIDETSGGVNLKVDRWLFHKV